MNYLSASSIKELEKCTWKYWCRKILQVPDKSNAGASRGTVCHEVFELLMNGRHKHHYDTILKAKTIQASPSIDRLVKNKIAGDPYLDEVDNKGNNNYNLINQMIVNGLSYNFYREGEKLYPPESYFEIKNDNPKYSFRGFIDKLSEDDARFVISDYKSSAEPFTEQELEMEIQAAAYSLWAMKAKKKPSRVEFIFLRHPEDPVRIVEYTREELLGFEVYFSYWQGFIDNIDETSAKLRLAADLGYPKPEEGFSKKLMCGYPSHPHQRKKNGDAYYYCPYKFKMYFWGVYDNDKLIKTFLLADEKDALSYAEDKYEVRKMFYAGCPAYQRLNQEIEDDWQNVSG